MHENEEESYLMADEPMTTARAIALMRACLPVLADLDASGLGITMPLTDAQRAILRNVEALESVAAMLPGGGAWWLDDMSQLAGLLPSDWSMLAGVLRHDYLGRPGVEKDMVESVLRQLESDFPVAETSLPIHEVHDETAPCFCDGADPTCGLCGGTGRMPIHRIG